MYFCLIASMLKCLYDYMNLCPGGGTPVAVPTSRDATGQAYLPRTIGAAVVELAYTYVSGTYGRKAVRVQVPPAAPFVQGASRFHIGMGEIP